MHQVVCATTDPAKVSHCATSQMFGKDPAHLHPLPSRAVYRNALGGGTRAGARNRVANARRFLPEADFWVAIEAGMDGDSTFGWVVIETPPRGERVRLLCRYLR